MMPSPRKLEHMAGCILADFKREYIISSRLWHMWHYLLAGMAHRFDNQSYGALTETMEVYLGKAWHGGLLHAAVPVMWVREHKQYAQQYIIDAVWKLYMQNDGIILMWGGYMGRT